MNEVIDSKTNEQLRHICIMIYALYALSSILQFHETTLIPGLLTILVAVSLNLSKNTKATAKGTIFESHLRWAFRTFWIGSFILLPIAVAISTGLILTFTSVSTIASPDIVADSQALMNAIHSFLNDDIGTVMLLSFVTMGPLLVWWLRRCWLGYKALQKDKPVENVNSWL